MSDAQKWKDPRPYEHRFHAGNVGDVWKHIALVAWLDALQQSASALSYVDTHAGAGHYQLGPTGEWREGVGKLLDTASGMPEVVKRYFALVRPPPDTKRGMRYPGSPVLAAHCLRSHDAVYGYEKVSATATELERALRHKEPARVEVGDGVAALGLGFPHIPNDHTLAVHVDPPWVEKSEWLQVPDAIIAAARARPNLHLMLWYPVKSLTRPNAMMKRFQDARLAATLIELVTSPLSVRKNRLNGSGLIFVRPPGRLVAHLGSVAAWLGDALATHPGYYHLRTVAWGDRQPKSAGGSEPT